MYSYTKFTSDSGVLTKQYPSETAAPVQPKMSRGAYKVKRVSTHEELADEIRGLSVYQAHSYSLPIADACPSGRIVTKDSLSLDPGAQIIARSKDYFSYPKGPGILFVDIDSSDAEDEAIRKLSELYEPFGTTSYVYATSASYGIQGKTGYHLYFFVSDLFILKQAMGNLFDLSFNHGFGFFKVSSAGRLLKRSFFDNAVYDQARLDFIAGPVCEGFPMPEREIRVVSKADGVLDLKPLLVPVDTSIAIQEARELVRPEMKATRTVVAAEKGITLEEYERRLEDGVIKPSETLYDAQGNSLDLEDILFKSSKGYLTNEWNEEDEQGIAIQHPEEGGLSEKTMLYYNHTSGCPTIHTYAHGGQVWKLVHTEESFDRLTEIGNEYNRKHLGWKHGLSPLELDNRLPPHEKTDEVYHMMLVTFDEVYDNDRILEKQWKDQISLYLHMILEGHKGRYSIELGMGSAKTQVILHVILYLYREGYKIPIAASFEKIKEIDENYDWLIKRMVRESWGQRGEDGSFVLMDPWKYLVKKHSQIDVDEFDYANAPVVFHTHYVVRKEDFLDSFYAYKGEMRRLFIYDEALSTGLEMSVKVKDAINQISSVINEGRTDGLQGLPFVWLREVDEILVRAQRTMNRNQEITSLAVEVPFLPSHMVKTAFHLQGQTMEFLVPFFQVCSSENRTLHLFRENRVNYLLGFKVNQTAGIDRLINTDSSRTMRQVHQYSSHPIEKYAIPEWTGDEQSTITIVPFKKTGREAVKKDHAWHIQLINEWQQEVRSRQLLICTSKAFPVIATGVPQGALVGIPRGLAHDNVTFTTWGKHKQTNEYKECDGIVALHYHRLPGHAYKNSICAEQGYYDELDPPAVTEVEYGSVVEALQQLFGRGTRRDGKRCDCLLFAYTLTECEQVGLRLEKAFPRDKITFFKRSKLLMSTGQSTDYSSGHGGSPRKYFGKERDWAKNFKRAARDKGYENFLELTPLYIEARREDERITPVKWLEKYFEG